MSVPELLIQGGMDPCFYVGDTNCWTSYSKSFKCGLYFISSLAILPSGGIFTQRTFTQWPLGQWAQFQHTCNYGSFLVSLLICWCSLPQHLDLLSICFCCWVTKHYSPGSRLCVFNRAVSVHFVRSKVVLGGCAAVWTGDPQAWITFTESYVSRGPKRSSCQQCAWPFATAYFGLTPCSWGGFLPNSTDKPAHPQKINGWPAYRKIAIKTNVCTFLFFSSAPPFSSLI